MLRRVPGPRPTPPARRPVPAPSYGPCSGAPSPSTLGDSTRSATSAAGSTRGPAPLGAGRPRRRNDMRQSHESHPPWTMVYPGSEPFVGLRQALDRLLAEGIGGSPFQTLWARAGAGPTPQPLPLDVYATDGA